MITIIDTTEYCRNVSEFCKRFDHDIHPEQIKEAIGAISNLYYESLIKSDTYMLSVTTDYTLISKYVSQSEILDVIEKATGLDSSKTKMIKDVLDMSFSDLFKEYILDNFYTTIYFKPFGKFQLKKGGYNPEFLMTYEVPNKENLAEFLFL